MKQYPKTTVLLLNWNGIELTKQSLQSLLKQDYPNFEVILLDNGSDNHEAEQLEHEFKRYISSANKRSPQVTLIKKKSNLGYAIGMNEAFKQATGEFVAIVNNDMEFEKNFLSELAKVLKSDEKIAICQPKLKQMKNRNKFDYAIAAGGYMDILGYPFARGRIFTDVEKDKGQYDSIATITWCGIFMGKRRVLQKTGLFDPIYVNYGEDMDLCFRVYGAGYLIVNVPSAVGYHVSAATFKRNLFKKMSYHHRNNLFIMIKNFDLKWLLSVIVLRLVLDWISVVYYLYRRAFSSALAVLYAHLSLIYYLPDIIEARGRTQKKIHQNYIAQMPLYRRSIVFDHFIKHKRTFSSLPMPDYTYIIKNKKK